MSKFCALSLLLLMMLVACKPGIPSEVISPDDMEDILVDYHLAQGMASQVDGVMEVERYKYLQAVFQKHGIEEAEFDSAMVYYSQHSELMSEIYDRVLERVQAKAQSMGVNASASSNRFANLKADGDTANVWADRKFVVMFPNRMQNVYQFHLAADSSFHAGDAFIWHFTTEFITQAMMHEAFAQVSFEYENDSVVTRDCQIRGTMDFDLQFEPREPLDTIPVRNIRGFVFMPTVDPSQASGFQLLILRDFSLVRMHRERVEPVVEPQDTIETDEKDSLLVDTLIHAPKASDVRLTPVQMRDNQPREKKIHVVKEKELLRPGQRQMAPRTRRRTL